MTSPVYTPVIRLPPKRKPSLKKSISTTFEIFEPKDCLVSDTLFLSILPKNVRETDIRTLLQHCMPIEIIIDREKDIGQLRFSQPKYADRAYSLYNGFTFTNNTKLQLQMYQDGSLDPEAIAALLEINGLPEYFDDNKLYDLFRPFGPLNLCKCVLKDGAFRGTAFIQFFHHYSSLEAERNLNDRLLDGYKLFVVPFMPSKTHAAVQYHQLQHQLQLQQQKEETDVDIMNLYVKNLDPHITNNDLTQIFRKFGRIISARVMTNPQTGQSKGYGFVSYGKSEEAALALQEMDGIMLGNRPLTVAYHEPRKGSSISNNNNRLTMQQPQDYSNTSTTNSYYNNHHNQYQQRSINNTTPINGLGIDNVDELGMNINLKDLSIGQKPSTALVHNTTSTTINLPQRKLLSSPQFSSGTTSTTGRSLASLASGLSIQQPPPPPVVVNLGGSIRPTLRRRGSLESVMTESSANMQRTKLHDAVRNCGDYGKVKTDIVDMLLTLKRKERSLCLFNPDFLREKVNLALEALDTCNESDESEEDVDGLDMEYTMRNRVTPKKPSSPLPPPQPHYNGTTTRSSPVIIPPLLRRESKAIPIVAPPPPPSTTISLTKENLANNKKMVSTTTAQSSLSAANRDVEALLFSFEGKPIHEKKQLLGDKLFPLVKSTGTRQAPKITIYLLDTVDLHELAKIMYDTPLLKQRVEDAFQSILQQQTQ